MIVMVIVIITMGQTCFSALLRSLSAAFESFSSSLTSATYINVIIVTAMVMVMVMVMVIQEDGEAHLLDKHLPLLLPPSPLSLPQAS